MKRFALLIVAVACAAAAASGASAAQPQARLTEAGGAKFPFRAYVISLSSAHQLSAADLKVTENGGAVVDPTLVPAATAAGKTFGSVLVLDSSLSMRGKPLANALEASRAFAAHRNANRKLAFVTFNNGTTVVFPFTTSNPMIDSGLSTTPTVAYGTRIYDAVARAIVMLEAAKVDSGSVVLLSDGADTGSKATSQTVIDAAKKAHIRVFTIGLRSASFKPAPLKALAAGTGGEYSVATTSRQLKPLFDRLGAELSREYLLQYKSLAGPKTQVRVNVVVDGLGTVKSAYQTPALPITTVPPYKQSLVNRFWTSPVVMVLVALLVAALLLAGIVAVAERRNTGLRRRMGEFVTLSDPAAKAAPRPSAVSAAVVGAGETLSRWHFWRKFEEDVEIAEIKWSPLKITAWTVVATVFAAILLDLIFGSWFALIALLVPFASRAAVTRQLNRRRKAFAEQLPDSLQVMASALRAGHSLPGAMAVVVDTSSDPMKSEMQRVVADEQLGVPLEDAIGKVAVRMANRDLEQVALVAKLQRESGGNAAEVLDRVVETVRERFELRRLVQTLTAQGRMSRWIVSFLPIGLAILITLLNPHYLSPLFNRTAGIAMLITATFLVVLGSYVIKRIVDIKV